MANRFNPYANSTGTTESEEDTSTAGAFKAAEEATSQSIEQGAEKEEGGGETTSTTDDTQHTNESGSTVTTAAASAAATAALTEESKEGKATTAAPPLGTMPNPSYLPSSSSLPDPSSSSSSSSTSSAAPPSAPSYMPHNAMLGGPDLPSRVIHCRNVIASVTKNDLMGLAASFGNVAQVVIMRSKNQALIQMDDLDSAKRLMDYYESNHAQVRGRRIYMRFSRHQELTSTSRANRIILVTLQTDNFPPAVPISVDVIWQIFSPYGFVEKIVTINKQQAQEAGEIQSSQFSQSSNSNSKIQALVQYPSEPYASLALNSLNGQTVYVGSDPIVSITLDIQYSNLNQLIIKPSSAEQSRDYTLYYQGLQTVSPFPQGGQPAPQFPGM